MPKPRKVRDDASEDDFILKRVDQKFLDAISKCKTIAELQTCVREAFAAEVKDISQLELDLMIVGEYTSSILSLDW